jgi:curli biogenesis system outer membrane secretion channel CsgG
MSFVNKNSVVVAALTIALLSLNGCSTTESHKIIQSEKLEVATIPYAGQKLKVSVGNFDNKSEFMRGIFSNNQDTIGNQTKTILTAQLSQSNRFSVLDRANMQYAKQEAAIGNQAQNIKGANYLVTGSITEFGRKEVGDHQLFGILGHGKSQIAYAKITLNIVDIRTSEVVYSTQGAGEYTLSSRDILGFGSSAGYDSTLTGKVLDVAVRNAVDNFSKAIDNNTFKSN